MKTLTGMHQLSKQQIECCLILWGCVPYDTNWIRRSILFKDKFHQLYGQEEKEEKG